MTSMLAFENRAPVRQGFTPGSPEWHAWRRAGVGSSDLAVLMGVSEYGDTPRIIWKRKKGLIPEKEMNRAMEAGVDNEPRARALYELDHDYDCPEAQFEHPSYPWAKASLDGFNEERQIILEIKCNGREKFEMARNGKVPHCYYPQIQWQLFVTGAKVAHFVSLDPETKNNVEVVPVLPDYPYWEKMIEVAQAFWECIETNTPPPLTPDDFMELDSSANVDLFTRWEQAKFMTLQLEDMIDEMNKALKGAKTRIKEQEEKLEAARLEIQGLTKTLHPKLRCKGVKAFVVQRKGGPTVQIDWEKKDSACTH